MTKSVCALFILFAITITKSEKPKCAVSDAQMKRAGTIVFVVGDRNVLKPKNVADVDKHCTKMRKNLKTIEDYAKCQAPLQQQVMRLFVRGYRKALKVQCNSTTWKTGYHDTVQCIVNSGKTEQVHDCADKISTTIDYAIEKVPAKDQLLQICCAFHAGLGCVKNTTEKLCGDASAEFLQKAIYDYLSDILQFVCSTFTSYGNCETNYPEYVKAYNKIFSGSVTPNKNMFESLLNLVMKQQS